MKSLLEALFCSLLADCRILHYCSKTLLKKKLTMEPMHSLNFYASRISHFLRGIRAYKNLTQSEVAKLIKVSVSTVSRAESEKLDSLDLDVLLRLSELADMRLSNFIHYLEHGDSKDTDLSPWQRISLDSLGNMKTVTRSKFIKNVLSNPSIAKQEELLNLTTDLSELKESTFEKIHQLIKELKN